VTSEAGQRFARQAPTTASHREHRARDEDQGLFLTSVATPSSAFSAVGLRVLDVMLFGLSPSDGDLTIRVDERDQR
jgi:hypothetical protein